MRSLTALGVCVLIGSQVSISAHAGHQLADGWTRPALGQAFETCTEELVQGAWRNAKRKQGIDPERPLTPEVRAKLTYQIDAFRGLCRCTVKRAARRYGRSAYEAKGSEINTFVRELAITGRCQPRPLRVGDTVSR